MPSIQKAVFETVKSYPGVAREILSPQSYNSVPMLAARNGTSKAKEAGRILGAQMAIIFAPIYLISRTCKSYRTQKSKEFMENMVEQASRVLSSHGLSPEGAIEVAKYVLGCRSCTQLSESDKRVFERLQQEAPDLFDSDQLVHELTSTQLP